MPLFLLHGKQIERIKELSFTNEKEIQHLVESNLHNIFRLDYVASEMALNNFRIDSLAFDKETKSFVIIEYKKDKNYSVVDQGYAYLALLLNNKADFILEYNENMDTNLKRDAVDWSQSKVIFISPQFTKYQKQAINFRDLPIELWEIKKYANDSILFNQMKSPETSESITTISSSETVQKVSKEIKVYTENDHLENKPEKIVELYEEIKSRILRLGNNIELRPRKKYIGFVANTNFVDIHLQKSQLKLWLNLRIGELSDPKDRARDVSKIGHWGNGDYETTFNTLEDLDDIMTLIKQSYLKNS